MVVAVEWMPSILAAIVSVVKAAILDIGDLVLAQPETLDTDPLLTLVVIPAAYMIVPSRMTSDEDVSTKEKVTV